MAGPLIEMVHLHCNSIIFGYVFLLSELKRLERVLASKCARSRYDAWPNLRM